MPSQILESIEIQCFVDNNKKVMINRLSKMLSVFPKWNDVETQQCWSKSAIRLKKRIKKVKVFGKKEIFEWNMWVITNIIPISSISSNMSHIWDFSISWRQKLELSYFWKWWRHYSHYAQTTRGSSNRKTGKNLQFTVLSLDFVLKQLAADSNKT